MPTQTKDKPTATTEAAEVKPAEAETPAPKLATFTLTEAHLAAIAPKGGRKVKPSVYLEEVKAAIVSGDAMGIPVTGTLKAPWIMGQIRKAAKDLKVTVQQWDRSTTVDPVTGPFVGFKVVPKVAEPAADEATEETAAAPE